MDAGDWERLKELYERARALPAPERAAFLERACGSDSALRSELEALLDAEEGAESFFGRLARAVPPIPDAPPADAPPPPFAPLPGAEPGPDPLLGRTVRQYRIEARLGAGGMGVVYRAHDTSLDRPVALKFLPQHVGAEEAAAERFLVEARAAAALDHPNVCAVYEIGETEAGRRFLVMACYEGETLREKLARGPIPVEEAADYAGQVAAALGAAHARGIVHRDIKPGNVLVTPQGTVKVLDFGLAKLSDVTLTGAGHTLGTVAYMAPEQLRGEVVDARTDLWALGVVWYEMLAGRRPFPGEDTAAVAYRIQHEEPPPVAALRPEVPEETATLLTRLLAKDPDDRPLSARTLLDDSLLDVPRTVPADSLRRSRPGSRWRAGRRIAAGLALLVATASLGLLLAAVSSPARPGLPEGAIRPLTDRGDVCSAAISPDGRRVVYMAGSRADIQLWARDVGSAEPPLALASLELDCAARRPRVRWRDSITVWFTGAVKGRWGLHAVPAGGGAVRRLHDGCTFDPSPDGSRVACILYGGPLIVADPAFQDVDTLSLPDLARVPDDYRDHDLAWSPSGEWLAVVTADSRGKSAGIALVSPDGRRRRPLLQEADSIGGLAWSPDSEALYFLRALPSGTDLMRLDSVSSEVPRRASVVRRLPRGTVAQVTLGRAEGRAGIVFTRSWSRIVAVDVAPGEEPRHSPVTDFGLWVGGITVTPDGESLVYYGEGPTGRDVYRMPVSGGEAVRLTSAGDIPYSHSVAAPAVSPDGLAVAYFAPRGDSHGLFFKHEWANRSVPVEGVRLHEWGEIHWSDRDFFVQPEDGRNLLRLSELRIERAETVEFSTELLAGAGLVRAKGEPLVPPGQLIEENWFLRARAAPGGYPIAFRSNMGLWLIRGPGTARERITRETPNPMGWTEDGRYLFATNWSSDVRRYDIHGGEWTFLGSLPEGYRGCTIAPDGATVYCKELREESDVWVVEDLGLMRDLDVPSGPPLPARPSS